jgi:electron transfer flavoprotein beta subunit
VPFELVALDGPASGFTEAAEVAAALAEAIQAIPGLDKSRLLVFGGWESASRGAGATMQMLGERLGIMDQFQGVDELKVNADGSLEILERIEGGKHQVSKCAGAPGVARLGHRQFARTEKQSAGRHGQHAHRDARACKRPSPSNSPAKA